ncbi:hypothetical protein PENSUB_4570 [Penicillium subrubescens]|jgi:hypothetical protein|uniref:Uncharacterized protein n=1 Tax=Penicillium subrubescens TaxID=1316194 RepID=A0A1Q5UC21_9EURO|nr:hypothetical protein PENSUB_4570 [Penicillium subrubescens]
MNRATYNAADYEEPNDNPNCFTKFLDVASRNPILVAQMFLDKLQAHKQVEDGRNADRPEESYENGLPNLFNLVDPLVHAKHPRQICPTEAWNLRGPLCQSLSRKTSQSKDIERKVLR